MASEQLLVVGLGYSGAAIAKLALGAGMDVRGTVRHGGAAAPAGVAAIPVAELPQALQTATHLVVTAPPGEAGDPVLQMTATAIRTAPRLVWIGYLSTTGVYGDRGGGWVDEATEPSPGQPRSRRRLQAELGWREAAAGRPLDLMRLAGIYGPGRSPLDEVRAGRARRIVLPGHCFGRIHRDDIAGGVLAAMARPAAGARVLNFSDDEPAESQAVIAEAARLLGVAPPPAMPFDEASRGMSDMARSFWSENRKVSSRATQAAIGRSWKYPSYREGLRAILAEERAEARA